MNGPKPCFSKCVWGNSSTGMTWELVGNTELSGPTTDLLNQNLHLTTDNLTRHSPTATHKALEGNTYQQKFERKRKKLSSPG